MPELDLGTEQLLDEDRIYEGSRFRDVVDALFANPYQRVWGREGEPPLPVHEVSLGSFLPRIFPFGAPQPFVKAAERAVDSGADLRWGPDRKGFRRLLHPNGVCLIGQWRIKEETQYSGYFAKGSAALTIGRDSTCCTQTRRGHTPSLSLVGKLFPTMDPNPTTPLRTANFITQEDIGGAQHRPIQPARLGQTPAPNAAR